MSACLECGREITSSRKRVCCSDECRAERHKRQGREHAKQKYVPASPNPPRACERCGTEFVPYRATSIWCSDLCKRLGGNERRKGRYGVEPRTCSKCGKEGLSRKPGTPVCDDCKVDPRRNQPERNRRRRLRTYGLTVEQYERIMVGQGGRCAICGADDFGYKGPSIDHDHASGRVRGILCNSCNLGIGQLGDDPERLAAAIEYLAAG